jgi:hypothetical protein
MNGKGRQQWKPNWNKPQNIKYTFIYKLPTNTLFDSLLLLSTVPTCFGASASNQGAFLCLLSYIKNVNIKVSSG